MLNLLMPALSQGAKVTVVTRPPSDYKEKDWHSVERMAKSMIDAGINLLYKSGIHQKFAVVDQRIVWYGSINLLSFGRSEESIMRLDSLNIADELIGSLEL